MECRNLEIIVKSAKGLKEMNMIGKMDPYVSVCLSNDPDSKQKTEVDTDGGKSPKWKGEPMIFVINEDLVSDIKLEFKIMAEKPFGDKEVGEVEVPVKELLADGAVEKSLSYDVKTPSGKTKGELQFTYKLSEKYMVQNPLMAYPDPYAGNYQQQQVAEYGYMQPQPGPYGYPAGPGYGTYPGDSHQHEKNSGMGTAGAVAIGAGAGLVGGLVIADMVDDAGEEEEDDD